LPARHAVIFLRARVERSGPLQVSRRRARAAASPAVDDRATKSPNTTVAESREPSFPAIVANWNAPLPPALPPLGGAPALAPSSGARAASAPKPPRARSAALARRASHRA